MILISTYQQGCCERPLLHATMRCMMTNQLTGRIINQWQVFANTNKHLRSLLKTILLLGVERQRLLARHCPHILDGGGTTNSGCGHLQLFRWDVIKGGFHAVGALFHDQLSL
jgi:hypothetical protein